MLKRLLLICALAFTAVPAAADETSIRDVIVAELKEEGFTEIRISRTLLGRLRFVATNRRFIREIVVNPSTGIILRDYTSFNMEDDDDDNDPSEPTELEFEDSEDGDDPDDDPDDDSDDESDDDDERDRSDDESDDD